jgi:hypothetical protein
MGSDMSCMCSTDTIEPENRTRAIHCRKCNRSHLGNYNSPNPCDGCYRCDSSKR